MKSQNICVFDLDNTLYDFIDFYAPAFRGMISAISQKTGFSKEELIQEARKIYTKKGFLEYAFLVREIKLFEKFNIDKIEEIEKTARTVFGRVRKKRMKLYPNIYNVISELHQGGIEITAVTNAPCYQTCKRLEELKLKKFFTRVICIENPVIPKYYKQTKDPCNKLIITEINRKNSKPSSYPYQKLKEFYSNQTNFWVIGDNIDRDLKPAKELGYKTIWASYGCEIDEKNYQTVLELTPPKVKKHEIAQASYEPDYIIKNPIELLDIIPYTKQLNLFDFIKE